VEYLIIQDDEELLGMAVVGKCSVIMCEAHNLLLPHLGWKRRLKVADAFFSWLEKQGYRRVVGKVPGWNRYAIAFDHAIGMKLFGVNEKAIMRNGKLEDEICFGLSLPRVS
jgi:RimJ/RimL family protein N-acetyltransferase